MFDNTREGMYGPQVHIGDAGLLLRSKAAREDGGLRFGNTGDRNGTSAATGNRHGPRVQEMIKGYQRAEIADYEEYIEYRQEKQLLAAYRNIVETIEKSGGG